MKTLTLILFFALFFASSVLSLVVYVEVPPEITLEQIQRGEPWVLDSLDELENRRLRDLGKQKSLRGIDVIMLLTRNGKPLMPDTTSQKKNRGGSRGGPDGDLTPIRGSGWTNNEWYNEVKPHFNLAEPIIKEVYGPPFRDVDVRISKNPDLGPAGRFSPSNMSGTSRIQIKDWGGPVPERWYSTLTHEMIHAFRDDWVVGWDQFEEGMTEGMEVEVQNRIYERHGLEGNYKHLYHKSASYYEHQLSNVTYNGTNSSDFISKQYKLASYAWWKVFKADPDFMIRFNWKLHDMEYWWEVTTYNESRDIAFDVYDGGLIEGKNFQAWFNNNPILLNNYPVNEVFTPEVAELLISAHPKNKSGFLGYKWRYRNFDTGEYDEKILDDKLIKVRIWNLHGELLEEREMTHGRLILPINHPLFENGRIKIEAYPLEFADPESYPWLYKERIFWFDAGTMKNFFGAVGAEFEVPIHIGSWWGESIDGVFSQNVEEYEGESGVSYYSRFLGYMTSFATKDKGPYHIYPGGIEKVPPVQPQNLDGLIASNTVHLDWSDNLELDLEEYNIYRKIGAEDYVKANTDKVTESEYSEQFPSTNDFVFYRVTALDLNGYEGGFSDPFVNKGPELTVDAVSESEIELNWQFPENPEGFEIEWSYNANTWFSIPLISGEIRSYIHCDLTRGTQYYYRIKAIYHVNESPFSNIADAITFWLNSPSELTATGDSYSRVTLHWKDNSIWNNLSLTNEGWIVEYWPENESHTQLSIADDNEENDYDEYTVTNLKGGKVYHFLLYAKDADGHISIPSEEVLVSLMGVEDFTAIGLDKEAFLKWQAPSVTFATEYLVLRKIAGDPGDIDWTPTDGEEYDLEQLVYYNNEIDLVIYKGYDTYFQDGNLTNGIDHYYAIFAFDDEFYYSDGQYDNARPTDFMSGWGKSYNMVGSNSAKLIVTALDSICVVYLRDHSTDGRAEFTDYVYGSKYYGEVDWNDQTLYNNYGRWNGVTIASSEEGYPCFAYAAVDPFTPEDPTDFVRYLTLINGERLGELVDTTQKVDVYFHHPSMIISGDSAFISYVRVNEGNNHFFVDSLRFVAFAVPGPPEQNEIDIQKLSPLGQVFDCPSVAVCEENGVKYVHIVWREGTAAESRNDYEPGKLWHIYGWLSGGNWNWQDPIEISSTGCHPCLVPGLGNTLYLVWNEKYGVEERDKIYFRNFDGNIWLPAEEVCDLPSLGPYYRQRYYPVAVHDNENVIVAWETAVPSEVYNVFYSERDASGHWTDPINVHPSVNHHLRNPHITLSRDKTRMFVICAEDYNNLVFTDIYLHPVITEISSPDLNDIWDCGEDHNIGWDATDNTEGLVVQSIEYSTSGGPPWILIGEEEENDGVYEWTVPDTPSNCCRIRITVRDHAGNIVDKQSEIFEIRDSDAPLVALISPSGGQQWNIGETMMIQWMADDNIGIHYHELFYSENGGTDWEQILIEGEVQQYNGNEYAYAWEIPKIFSENCKIRVVSYDFSENFGEDQNPYPFTIWDYEASLVRIEVPNGADVWEIKTSYDVEWQATDNVGITSHKLYYSTNNGVIWEDMTHGFIAEEPGGNYSCEWITPEVYSSHCLVKVECSDGAGNSGDDESDNAFTIGDFTPPVVTVIRPNGGENIEIGSEYVIAWDAVDNGTIEDHYLWYSTNSGENWLEIPLAHPPQQGSYIYPWDVPGTPSMNCLLKARSYDAAENYGEDISDGTFKISWYVSNNSDATAYSPKVVKANNNLHLVYTSNDSIYYAQSVDDGESFERKYFIGLGGYPTIISNGDANLYALWSKGNQLFYRRFDGTRWLSGILLGTISSVTELRQVIGCIDAEGRIQMALEGMYTMGRGIESNIAFHATMARNDPNTFEYDAITVNAKPDESATISFDLDMYGIAYLVFSYNGRVYCYSNERGYWAGGFIVGYGCDGYIDSYDGYVHVVWEEKGVIKHKHRLIRVASWFLTETVSSDIHKYYKNPIFDKGCVAVYAEIPRFQPDHISNIVYRIRDRGIWEKQEYLTEGLNADYPQIYTEDYRDYNAKLYAAYTEATFALSSIELAKKEITIPHQTSDILQATAYNFQDKMVLDADSTIHIVYQDRVNIMYAYSEDGGEIFSEDIILGEGRAPVIALLPDDEIGISGHRMGGRSALSSERARRKNGALISIFSKPLRILFCYRSISRLMMKETPMFRLRWKNCLRGAMHGDYTMEVSRRIILNSFPRRIGFSLMSMKLRTHRHLRLRPCLRSPLLRTSVLRIICAILSGADLMAWCFIPTVLMELTGLTNMKFPTILNFPSIPRLTCLKIVWGACGRLVISQRYTIHIPMISKSGASRSISAIRKQGRFVQLWLRMHSLSGARRMRTAWLIWLCRALTERSGRTSTLLNRNRTPAIPNASLMAIP